MTIIVEAQPGAGRRQPGRMGFAENGLPDLQMILSRPLGDGSVRVCDTTAPMIGGVPATVPLAFTDDATVIDAINDFGCRVNDGAGLALARATSADACTSSNDGGPAGFAFVSPQSSVQYCLPIARPWRFPTGDTVIAARVRDTAGVLGPIREIVVRIDDGVHGICDGDERIFTVDRPRSVFRSANSALADVSRDPWSQGPLVLCVGDEDADGRRALRLRDDVTLGLTIVDGSVLCVHLEAEGSGGSLDCDGGSAHGVVITQDSHADGSGEAPRVETGVGTDAGAGAATLTTSVGLALLPAGSTLDRCQFRPFGLVVPAALTTATAIATVVAPIQGGEVSIDATGEPFDCAHLLETDSAGTFVLPFPALDTVVGDTADVLLLAD
jgi:hypothetical protein